MNISHGSALRHLWTGAVALLAAAMIGGCGNKARTVIVYVGVDQPMSQPIFDEFERETGIHVQPVYDVESSRSITLSARLEAECDNPRADVWWGSEWFLTERLADSGVLQPYASAEAADIPAVFKDPHDLYTGMGVRVRVLAMSTTNPPPFKITSLQDLLDPRLKGKICMARPTSGATVAHVAALYAVWGREKAGKFFRGLHDNQMALLGGNAEVASAVGQGEYCVGLTDCDDVENAIRDDGAKETMVIPDQGPDQLGTLAMPTTIGLVKGCPHPELARQLIDFLVKKQTEQKLIDENFARYSVRSDTADKPRGSDRVRLMKVDYARAVEIYPVAQDQATSLLDGR